MLCGPDIILEPGIIPGAGGNIWGCIFLIMNLEPITSETIAERINLPTTILTTPSCTGIFDTCENVWSI